MDFSELAIKGRDAQGNILTKNAVHKIIMKEKGVSTLGGRKIWFDEDVLRLNADGRGKFLGEFGPHDTLLVVTKSGSYRTSSFDLENHFEDDLHIIEKFKSKKVWSVIYFDADQNYYYVKRFMFESGEKPVRIIGDHPESKLISITEVEYPRFEINFGGKNKDREPEIIEVADFIGIKSPRAKGKRLSNYQVDLVKEIEPLLGSESEESEGIEAPEAPVSTKAPVETKAQKAQKAPKAQKAQKAPDKSGSKPLPDPSSDAKTANGSGKKKGKKGSDEQTEAKSEPKAAARKAGSPRSKEAKSSAPTKKAGDPKGKSDKPGEPKKGDDPDKPEEPNGQMTLEW
jgi:hypothetical protein